ncbi:16S rRNA endonuclease CdiA-like isoform X2 [Ptychodera flava]|uniref:16S rRNA endonuclease CdiA-like isoform X2 n=1 Tax=Ptychodera flava TaxID=63121 RepID=UPI00396A48C9
MRNWSSIVPIVLLIVISSLSPSTAAVVRWKEAISGNWFDESKWHLGRLPTAEDDVAIDLDGSYQITVNGDATVTSIYMPVDTPTLRVTKLLRVHGNMNLNGALILDASSNQDDGLHLDGEGELNGDFNWRNGRLKSSSNGRLTINGMFHITPPSRYYGSNPRVRVDKLQVTITNAAVVDGNTMYFTNDGQFSIAEGAVLNMTNSPTIASEGGGTFLIEGSVNMNSTGTTSVGVNIHNFGAVNIEAGSLSLSGQTTWEGSLSMTTASQITFNGGRHTFLSSSNVVGIYAIRASSSAHVLFSCEKVEFNVIEVEAGTITVEQQTELNLRKLSVWNSARFELYLTKDGDTGNFKVDEISAVNAANIAVVGNVQVKRFIFNLYSGQSAVFDVVGHMSISDQWTWSSGVIQCTEDVVVEGDVSIEGSYRYYHKYARHGRYVFKKKVVLRTESNVNVESDAEFINEKDSEFVVTATGGSFGGGGTFENRGTLFVNSHQTTTYVFTLANFKNVGSVRLESSPGSVFEISADLTPSGTFYIGSDNTMILSGQSALTSDGVFDGPGTLQIQGSNYEFQSINVRTLRINSGSLVVPAPKNRITEQTIPKVYVNAGTLTLPSAETPLLIEELVVAGIGKVATNRHTEITSLHMSGGTLSGNGVISVTHVFVWEAGVIEGESGHQLIAERDVEVSTQNNKIVHRDLILKGNVTWVATDFDVTVEGKFIITEEASLTIIGDNFMFTTDDPGRGIVENYGNLEVNIPFGKFRLDLEFFNYGKMTVVAGDIELMSKHASIEGTVEFSDLTSSMLITGGNHRIVPDSYPEQGLGKLSVSDADLQVVDCNWAEVTINNGADVNVTYRTIVQPIMEKLVVTGGRVSISALTEGSLRSKDVACKGGQVTFYGDVIATKVTISDGILENQDKLEIVGDLVWIAGTVRGSQFGQTKMSIFGTMKLIGDSEKSLEEQSLEIHTEGVWFGSGNIMMSKSTTLVVMPGGTLTSKASGQFTDRDSTNVISNRGNFIIDSQSTTTSFVRFENEGVLTVSENAVFVLRGDSRSSGQVTVSRSADLHFLGGLHRWYGDPDTGSVEGSILVSDAEVQIFHFNVPGDLKAMDSGTLTLLTNREEQGLNTIYIDEDATININSAKKVARHFISRVVIGSGILNVGVDMTIEGATLLTKNAHLVCTRQVDVGELEWRGGSIEGDRKSELQVQDLQIDGKEEKTLIHKVIKLSKDAKMAGIGRFSMLGDATMNIESQAQVDILSSLTITSQKGMIRNYGQLNIVSRYSGNSGTASIEGNFLNNGTLSCRKGANLRISGTSQIDGKTEVASGSSLEFSDGEHVLVASSVVEGEGTLRVFRAPRTLYVKSANIQVGNFHVTSTATAVIQVPGITLTEVVVEGTLRISEDAVRVNVLTVNGGTVSVLKDTIVDRLVFNYGTIDLNANLACRVFHGMEERSPAKRRSHRKTLEYHS